MELPFTVVFEPPTRAELRAALSVRRVWLAGALVVLGIGAMVVLALLARPEALISGPLVSLRVVSHPAGAGVWVDGRERGQTPLETPVAAGLHSLTLKAPQALESRFDLQIDGAGTELDVPLLRRQPLLVHLRPTLPGASLADVRLLADGRLALVVSVGTGQLEAWRLDPLSGALEPLLTDTAATRLAVAPDAQHIAYLGAEIGPSPSTSFARSSGPPGQTGDVLWIAAAPFASPTAGWRPPAGDTLTDASWSPSVDGVLVVTRHPLADGTSINRVWWLDAAGEQARELQTLPSSVVPGSEIWSPDGQHVTFLAHAGQLNALCLLGLDGTFRYLADLQASDAPPLPYAPVGWSTDGQAVVFTAPRDQPTSSPVGWLQPSPGQSLFVARLAEPEPTLLRDADLALPGWQADGRILGLGRAGQSGPLALELAGPTGDVQRLVELSIRPRRGYAAQWNTTHTRVVIADPSPSGAIDYWAAVLGLEDAP